MFGILQAGGARILCPDPQHTLGTFQLLHDTQGLPAWGPAKLSSLDLGDGLLAVTMMPFPTSRPLQRSFYVPTES